MGRPIIKLITDINRCTVLYRNDRYAELGINATQAAFLQYIYNRPGMSQEQLARDDFVDKSTAARQLVRLEELGYILRRPNETDKRQLLMFPSDMLPEIMPKIREGTRLWREQVVGDMSEEEQEQLFHSLETLLWRAKAAVTPLNCPEEEGQKR